MARAICLIRPQPHYRRDAFATGLAACGYQVVFEPSRPLASDVLVIWNRYGANEERAAKWEAAGARVIVVENGYLGRDGAGRQLYALALFGHNGEGRWPVDEGDPPERPPAPPSAPWREGRPEAPLIILAQRGIGSAAMASPLRWHEEAARELRRLTRRAIRVRRHPSMGGPPLPPLEQDIADAWACVIWASSGGVRALVAGIPVFYAAPHWICAQAARRGFDRLEEPLCSDELRAAALRRMAWAQWTVDEIASGAPIRRLLSETRESEVGAPA